MGPRPYITRPAGAGPVDADAGGAGGRGAHLGSHVPSIAARSRATTAQNSAEPEPTSEAADRTGRPSWSDLEAESGGTPEPAGIYFAAGDEGDAAGEEDDARRGVPESFGGGLPVSGEPQQREEGAARDGAHQSPWSQPPGAVRGGSTASETAPVGRAGDPEPAAGARPVATHDGLDGSVGYSVDDGEARTQGASQGSEETSSREPGADSAVAPAEPAATYLSPAAMALPSRVMPRRRDPGGSAAPTGMEMPTGSEGAIGLEMPTGLEMRTVPAGRLEEPEWAEAPMRGPAYTEGDPPTEFAYFRPETAPGRGHAYPADRTSIGPPPVTGTAAAVPAETPRQAMNGVGADRTEAAEHAEVIDDLGAPRYTAFDQQRASERPEPFHRPDVSHWPEAFDRPDVSGGLGAFDGPGVSGGLGAFDRPDVSGGLGAFDGPGVSDRLGSFDRPETYDRPEALDRAEVFDQPVASDIAGGIGEAPPSDSMRRVAPPASDRWEPQAFDRRQAPDHPDGFAWPHTADQPGRFGELSRSDPLGRSDPSTRSDPPARRWFAGPRRPEAQAAHPPDQQWDDDAWNHHAAPPADRGGPSADRDQPTPSRSPGGVRLDRSLLVGLVVGIVLAGSGGWYAGRTWGSSAAPTARPKAATDPDPQPTLGIFEKSQIDVNRPDFADSALGPMSEGWLPYLSNCSRSGRRNGPVLGRGSGCGSAARWTG
jgi:hypothetical protein